MALALSLGGGRSALAQDAPLGAAPVAPAFGSPPVGAAPTVAPVAPQAAPEPGTGAPAAQASAPPPKPKRKPKPPAPPREMALSDDPTPVLQPETFFTTAKASERYAAIVDAGGWPKVGVALKPGSKGPAVVALRRRLAAEQELADAASPSWDAALTEAVKFFQFRMGLKQTGAVSGATLRALDVPAYLRFRQLASSAQRLAGVEFAFGPRYVVVNIPSAAVDAVENGRVVRRYTAIVGDVEHRSPEVEAKIGAVNINPTWTVPASIIKNEIAPKMLKDPSYLTRSRIRVLDGRGAEVDPRSVNWSSERAANYTLRQDFGGGQFARVFAHLHAQSARRLYARHANEKFILERLSFSVARLCASRGSLRSRRLAARGRAGIVDRLLGQGDDLAKNRQRRTRGSPASASRPGDLGLFDGLGERRRRRSFPR